MAKKCKHNTDNVESNNQSGGITAHNVNIGTPINSSTHIPFYKNKKIIISSCIFLVAAVVATINDGFGIFDRFLKKREAVMTSQERPEIHNVTSNNQSGGITAHTVNVNSGALKRDLKSSAVTITAELQKYPPAAYRLHYSVADQEAGELAKEIDQILINAKWKRIQPIPRLSFSGSDLPKGITVYMLKPVEPILTFNNQLWNALGNKGVEGQVLTDVDNVFKVGGWPPIELPEGMSGVVIFVGANPEN